MGLLIATIGHFGGQFRTPTGPAPTSAGDFLYGMASGCALTYFLHNTAEHSADRGAAPRPLWAVGLNGGLLGLQAGVFLLNAVYGPGSVSYLSGCYFARAHEPSEKF
jgi:hypothetical protein